jgi:hypothetical protein
MKQESGVEQNKMLSPIIPKYEGRIIQSHDIPIHLDKTFWDFETDGQKRSIPVLSIWNYQHHAEISSLIAKGKAAGMYVWGSYGTAMLLNSPEWQSDGKNESEKLRTQLKKGRPWGEKFANFMHPDDMIDFWDIDRLHPDYRHLQWANNRSKLYDVGPIHIIAPTKKRNPHLDTSLVREEDQTASYFYMPHPAWNQIIELLRKDVKHSVFGGGSLNFHKEEPGFTTETLYKMISEKIEWQENIGLVVIDEIAEGAQVFRSQTQIRLPQVGSDGVCEIVRYGGVNPKTWANHTGYKLKEASEGVKFATSKTPYDNENNFIVDVSVTRSRDLMIKAYKIMGR